jgi:anti-anti-sigma factor
VSPGAGPPAGTGAARAVLARGRISVRIGGDLDADGAPELARTLADAAGLGSGDVCVDLATVTFIDSQALGVLVHVSDELERAGRHLHLEHPPHCVRHLVALAGADLHLSPRDAA